MTDEEKKTAQVNLRLQPSLKAAAEKLAAKDRRSLTSYIENLIMCEIERAETARKPARRDRPVSKKAASKASKMAAQEIDRLGDQSAAPTEREKRKRRLLKGPAEFRELRDDLPKRKP
jgi:hypothetical protein